VTRGTRADGPAKDRTAAHAPRGAWSTAAWIAGPALFALVSFLGTPITAAGTPAAFALATALWMIAWWGTGAVPLWVTALLPLVVFPLAGVHRGAALERAVSSSGPYLSAYVLLFLGGMAIAAALQETGIHRRISLAILARTKSSPLHVLAGVFIATSVLSMWISNTAAATLVLPIALSLLHEIEPRAGVRARYAAALVLAVAWGANVGGIGTKIGTTTNMQLAGFLSARGQEVSFVEFALIGSGFVLIFVPLAITVLWRVARVDAPSSQEIARGISQAIPVADRWSAGERAVAIVFAATALAWINAQSITSFLASTFPTLGLGSRHVEAGAALAAAFVLAVWKPARQDLLGRESLRALPWSALLLIGGSFALADGIAASGLAEAIAPGFERLRTLPPFAQSLIVAIVAVSASAVASNTATIAILLPLIAAAAPPENALTLLFTATIASSCDFALPAGTPPNAIAFASGRVPFLVMLRTGAILDVLAAVVAAAWCALVVDFVLG